MENSLKFLKERFEIVSDKDEQFSVSPLDLNNVNQLFAQKGNDNYSSKQFKIMPRIEKNQIWSIKNEYVNFLGHTQRASHPFIVLIITEPDEIEEEDFIRVNVVSPFIEFSAFDDFVCNDSSIIGFPFLVETWNEQPVLAELLDEYLGYYEREFTSIIMKNSPFSEGDTFREFSETLLNEKINNYQKEFRDIEISKAKYLNSSIIALLSFLERRQSKDSGVVISIFDKTEFPKFYIGHNQKESDCVLAAKSGVDTEEKYFHYKASDIPFEIFFRKNEEGFIISVLPSLNVRLFTSENKEIEGTSNPEKIVFSNLKKGLYTLKSTQIQEFTKIRLK